MENDKCRKCGGQGIPTKGIMNFHNVQTQDKSKEFETKMMDCTKCEDCGHSWIPFEPSMFGNASAETLHIPLGNKVTQEQKEKAVAQLNTKDYVSGMLENDTVYLVVEDTSYELSEFEIAYQAKQYDEENEEEL